MTDTTKRGFLLGLAGATGLLVAQPKLLLSKLPILWGDGVHDGSDGLEALFNGEPVKTAWGDTFKPMFDDGTPVTLDGGKYYLGRTITLNRVFNLRNSTILTATASGARIVLTRDPMASAGLSKQKVSRVAGNSFYNVEIRATDENFVTNHFSRHTFI